MTTYFENLTIELHDLNLCF